MPRRMRQGHGSPSSCQRLVCARGGQPHVFATFDELMPFEGFEAARLAHHGLVERDERGGERMTLDVADGGRMPDGETYRHATGGMI